MVRFAVLNKRRIILFSLVLCLAAALFVLWPTDTGRIRKLIKEGAGAVESRDREGVMEKVSFNYRDDHGMTYLSLREVVKRELQRLSEISIEYENLEIRVSGDTATAQLDLRVIGFLLFFVMGPAEEIYWHGFVQRVLGERFGSAAGLFLTAAVYSLVHAVALNLMLLAAAAVCGLFWGWLYQREQSLIPVILSHSIWDVLIFLIFPLS